MNTRGWQGLGEVTAGRHRGGGVLILMGGPPRWETGQPLGSRSSGAAVQEQRGGKEGAISAPGLFKAGSGFILGASARES